MWDVYVFKTDSLNSFLIVFKIQNCNFTWYLNDNTAIVNPSFLVSVEWMVMVIMFGTLRMVFSYGVLHSLNETSRLLMFPALNMIHSSDDKFFFQTICTWHDESFFRGSRLRQKDQFDTNDFLYLGSEVHCSADEIWDTYFSWIFKCLLYFTLVLLVITAIIFIYFYDFRHCFESRSPSWPSSKAFHWIAC